MCPYASHNGVVSLWPAGAAPLSVTKPDDSRITITVAEHSMQFPGGNHFDVVHKTID
ncbi:uncharacterized protein FTOL_11261 [Fusarium torulosum]|uniref:Uncharacterized protein n=1 Tax=Fusarium torulosum TaxID=33205 RepID=A0AAE8SMU2_9HYPO|nr:uncharacterized protein FTOL_11261 [Fusarium torulosum]